MMAFNVCFLCNHMHWHSVFTEVHLILSQYHWTTCTQCFVKLTLSEMYSLSLPHTLHSNPTRQSFLLTVPQTPGVSFAVSDRVCIHTSVGRPVSESCLELGLLLEISPGSRDWEDHMTGVGDHMTGVEGGRGRGGVLTALFDVSMSGDLPDGQNTHYKQLYFGRQTQVAYVFQYYNYTVARAIRIIVSLIQTVQF